MTEKNGWYMDGVENSRIMNMVTEVNSSLWLRHHELLN
jgi:hypothetical protein